MTPIFAVILSFGIIFTIIAAFAQGLAITVDSFKAGFEGRRQSEIMLLIAKLIAVPFLLIGLAIILPFEAVIKMAVIVCALTAGAPFIPWVTSLGKGNLAYSASASLLLTVLTFVLLPFTLPVVLNLAGTGATAHFWDVALPIIAFMVIPLAAGILIRARYLNLTQQIAPYLGPIAITALLLHITLFIAYTWSDITSLFLTGLFVFSLAVPVLSMVVGYLLSPPYVLNPGPVTNPHREDKIVSVVATSLSNTGVTILCAIFVLPQFTLAGDAILIIGLTTIIITVLAICEAAKRSEKANAASTTAGTGLAAQASK